MNYERLVDALGASRPGGRSVSQWSLHLGEWRRLSLGVKDGDAGGPHAPLSVSDSCSGRYLIVWDDGLVSRGSLERRQLDAPEEAIAAARLAAYEDADAARVLGPAAMPEVRLHDAAAAVAADGDLAGLAPRLTRAREAARRAGATTWSASFSAAAGRARVLSSSGLDAESAGTSTGWFVSLDGEIGDGYSARAAEPEAEFEARLDRLIELRARLRTPAAGSPSGERLVLVDPGVVEDWVLDTLLHNLEGAVVAHGEGHFPLERFGGAEPVLRDDLTLAVDPLLPLRSGSYRFTTEGLPAAPATFIDGGRLVQPVLDLKYAHRLGLQPTPVPAASDTIVLSGAELLELDDAMARADGSVLVLRVLGVHTQDKASGDFSLSAPQALELRDGSLGGRLRTTIAGNLFRVLGDPATAFVRFPGEPLPGMLLRCRLDTR